MRTGQNPAKSIEYVAQPERVTVAVVSYIPFLKGYYSNSLEVLKICLGSIIDNTKIPCDLLVFDNNSCQKVKDHLRTVQLNGDIQYLILSEKNIGKAGAWNFIFGSAPGELVAYSDADIYHYPGWLSALVEVYETFQNVGMITGIPMWSPEEFSTSTVEWANSDPEVQIEYGNFLPWEDYWRHAQSLGHSEEKARAHFENSKEYVIEYHGLRCYAGAGHFQFLAAKDALQSVLPIPSKRPMGQVRLLDKSLNDRGLLRLSTENWWVQHLGNNLEIFTMGNDQVLNKNPNKSANVTYLEQYQKNKYWLWNIKPVRRFLQWVHGTTFEILYRS
jgi:glycosyltransferase involved in cell wall biosynthesis